MRIDPTSREIQVVENGRTVSFPLASKEAFALLTEAWLISGWANRYTYGFSWLGRPIIQMPEDLIRIQELIYRLKPDVIIETGVAHGGSQVFIAGLCRLMGRGRVIGIDVEIRPHNRSAIEAHELAPLITLVEGDSAASAVVGRVRDLVGADESALVILDSNHSKAHVAAELEAYRQFVRPGGYIVVADGIMKRLAGLPRAAEDWAWDNPISAIEEFLARNSDFVLDAPSPPFNEGAPSISATHWPNGYLRHVG